MREKRRWWNLLFIGLFLTACGRADRPEPSIRIEDAWVRPAFVNLSGANDTVPTIKPNSQTPSQPSMDMDGSSSVVDDQTMDTGTVSVAYFTIINDGGEEDSLVEVASSVARNVSLHQTRYNGDIAEMVMIEEIVIPAKKSVELRPGSYHVMLVGLERDLVTGETIDLTLRFRKSGEILVTAEIKMK